MKYAVVILALVAAVSAQFNTGQFGNGQYNPFNRYNNQYNQQYNRNPYNRYTPYSTPSPFRYRPTTIAPPTVTIAPTTFSATSPAPKPTPIPVPVGIVGRYADGYNAEILKFGNENAPDGSYNYFYETSNGIAAQAQGTPRDFGGNPPVIPVVSQGSFSWTSPEGVPVAISYTADENGYQPVGDAIPTSPPIPELILRALNYVASRTAPQKK